MHPAAAAAAAAAAVAAWVGVQVIHTYLDVILKVILGLARRTSQAGSVDLCWSAAMHQLAHTVGVTQLIYVDLSTLWISSWFLYLACLAELACQVRKIFANGKQRGLVWLSSAYFCQTKLLA